MDDTKERNKENSSMSEAGKVMNELDNNSGLNASKYQEKFLEKYEMLKQSATLNLLIHFIAVGLSIAAIWIPVPKMKFDFKYCIGFIMFFLVFFMEYFRQKTLRKVYEENVSIIDKLLHFAPYLILLFSYFGGWGDVSNYVQVKFFGGKTGEDVMSYLTDNNKEFDYRSFFSNMLHMLLPLPLFIVKLSENSMFFTSSKEDIRKKQDQLNLKDMSKVVSNKLTSTTILNGSGIKSYILIFVMLCLSFLYKLSNRSNVNYCLDNSVDFIKSIISSISNDVGNLDEKKEGFQTMSKIDRDFVEIFKRKNKNNKLIHKLNEIFPLNHDKYSTVLQYSPINGKFNL